MKIIVVGMDNTGKTTLCNTLAVRTGFKVVPPVGPGRSRESMLENILLYMEKGESVIFERFSIFEELIYGKILRGKSKFDFKDIDIIKKYHPIIIYCRPSNETIFNFGDRDQMPGVIEQKEKLIQEWDRLINDSLTGFKIIKYDWTKDKLGRLLGGVNNEYYTCDE